MPSLSFLYGFEIDYLYVQRKQWHSRTTLLEWKMTNTLLLSMDPLKIVAFKRTTFLARKMTKYHFLAVSCGRLKQLNDNLKAKLKTSLMETIFIRILPTTFPQVFCNIILNSKVFIKSIIDPDHNIWRKS